QPSRRLSPSRSSARSTRSPIWAGALGSVPAKPNIKTHTTIAALVIGVLLHDRHVSDLSGLLVKPAALPLGCVGSQVDRLHPPSRSGGRPTEAQRSVALDRPRL